MKPAIQWTQFINCRQLHGYMLALQKRYIHAALSFSKTLTVGSYRKLAENSILPLHAKYANRSNRTGVYIHHIRKVLKLVGYGFSRGTWSGTLVLASTGTNLNGDHQASRNVAP
jgi:hypothetical protein